MDAMTTAEAVVASLVAHGIRTLYALPGVHNDHLFDALYKASDRIAVIHPRHEQAAAYMALGAALATGRSSAYAVVPGPGLLNTGAALLTAYAMNAPVLALIGQIPEADIGRGLGHLHAGAVLALAAADVGRGGQHRHDRQSQQEFLVGHRSPLWPPSRPLPTADGERRRARIVQGSSYHGAATDATRKSRRRCGS